MEAYQIAEEISKCKNNPERRDFVERMARNAAESLGYTLRPQPILDNKGNPINPIRGNANFLLDSGHPSPLTITAHYDAWFVDAETGFVPGANDNGSGVGALFQSMPELEGFPIDFILFGDEEKGLRGPKFYADNMASFKFPGAIVSLDSCGSGKPGILLPSEVKFRENLLPTSSKLNKHYLEAAQKSGLMTFTDCPWATTDYVRFIDKGIPSAAILGNDLDYYGFVNGKLEKGEGQRHTMQDTIDCVDPKFLEQVVQTLVEGSKNFVKSRR
jgi:Zn-dependent M28 family amino/carboxypeptidase